MESFNCIVQLILWLLVLFTYISVYVWTYFGKPTTCYLSIFTDRTHYYEKWIAFYVKL